MRTEFFELEAFKVVEKVLATPTITSKGLTWPTVQAAYDERRILRKEVASFANGVSGIAYFLLDAYLHFKDERMMAAGDKAIDWLGSSWRGAERINPSLYFGELGIAMPLLKAFDVTGDERYLKESKALIGACWKSFEETREKGNLLPCNLASGLAGMLTAVVLRIERGGSIDEELLDIAKEIAVRLCQFRARLADTGVYWERNANAIQPLCGFLLGNAGVAAALAQANKLFESEAIGLVIRQGLWYEDSRQCGPAGEWPDYSYAELSPGAKAKPEAAQKEAIRALLSGDEKAFFNPGYFSAWDNGSSGILVSRIACRQYYSSAKGFDEAMDRVRRALAAYRFAADPREEHLTLMHGALGIAASCRIAAAAGDFVDPGLALRIEEVAQSQSEALNRYRSAFPHAPNASNLGLLMGETGIGYYFLQQLKDHPDWLPVAPFAGQLPESKRARIGLEADSVATQILAKEYKRTLDVLKESGEENLEEAPLASIRSDAFGETFCQRIKEFASAAEAELLRETFAHERGIQAWDIEIRSHRYLASRSSVDILNNQSLVKGASSKQFDRLRLKLAPQLKLIETRRNLDRSEGNDDFGKEQATYYVVQQRPNKTYDIALPEFNFRLLSLFESPCSVGRAVDKIISLVDPKSENDRKKVNEIACGQIKEALKSGTLIEQTRMPQFVYRRKMERALVSSR